MVNGSLLSLEKEPLIFLIYCLLMMSSSLLGDFQLPFITLMNKFCNAMGQQINFSKSQVIFSKVALPSVKENVCNTFQIPEANRIVLYLGLPLPFGRGRNKFFSFLLNRVRKQMEG